MGDRFRTSRSTTRPTSRRSRSCASGTRKQVEAAGGNLTVTAIAVKIVATALKVFPQFNSSIDLAADEIIYKKYVNIGVAVDTDRGLLVPVIRDADTKNIMQIVGRAVAAVREGAATARSRSTRCRAAASASRIWAASAATFFTPIVNAPEVAILGISRAQDGTGLQQGHRTVRAAAACCRCRCRTIIA